LWLTHRRLDVSGFQVLPVLLEERNQEVEGHDSVLADLIFGHLSVANAGTKAKNLLQLELDGRLELGNLGWEVVSLCNGRWELTRTIHVGADETRDGLDDGLRGQEGIILVA